MFQKDLGFIFIFYLLGLLYSAVGFPIGLKLFKNFPDKGYGFARIIGFLLISYFVWLLSNIFGVILPASTIGILIIQAIIILYYFNRKEVLESLRSAKITIIIEEVLFIFFFIAMILYRGAVPKIEGIEKFMDFAIINGLLRAKSLPPMDVWYSGLTINYYYFGHFCLAVLDKLANIPSSILYNLDVAFIFGLSALGAFSINLALTKNKIFSLFGSFVLVLAGNLDYFYSTLILHKTNYFYAEARSIIAYTINEFPSYSFIISDLHAHILDIPFVLLFIGCLVSLFLTKSLVKDKFMLIFMTINLGAFGVTNSWDLLIYFPLFTILLLYLTFVDGNDKKTVLLRLFDFISTVFLIGVGSLFLFIFFYVSFRAGVGGVGFANDYFTSESLLRMFGFFLVSFIAFIVYIIAERQLTRTDKLVLIMFLYGIFLVFLPNVVFLKDIYFKLNPPYYRANTVFKVWYQAWIIMSLTSGYIYYQLFKQILQKRNVMSILLGVISIFFIVYIFIYPYISYKYVIGPKYSYVGLDGENYLTESYSGEKNVIDWLNKNVSGQPILLEATGKPYSMDSLIASYTGLPTIIGWNEHELGWRDDWPSIAYRMGDIEKMYTSSSSDEVKQLLQKYSVKYAVITNTERTKYGEAAGETLRSISKNILTTNGTELQEISF